MAPPTKLPRREPKLDLDIPGELHNKTLNITWDIGADRVTGLTLELIEA